MKKTFLVLIVALLSMACVFANGSSETADASASGLSGKLIIASNALDAQKEAFEDIIAAFIEENPNVEIEFTSYGKDYENLMKAKMAANDLPDIFATHGWSVKRYAEYLLPLNDMDFAGNLTASAEPVLTTPEGNLITLPMNFELTGIIVNREILKEAGWNEVPRTFDEFLACCKDIKALGTATPVYIAGKDTRQQANLMDLIAPSMLIATADNQNDALKDGSFDWTKWGQVSGFLYTLYKEGLLNKDCNTADPIYIPEKLAFNEIAFSFGSATIMGNAKAINPDAQLEMMPVPANTDKDEMILIGGERESYGIWKDGKNIDLAKAFIAFAAKPENIKDFCEKTGMPTAFNNVELDLPVANQLAAYGDLTVYPYFDREWLPSGMWATMRSTGGGITSEEITVEQSCKIMEKSYNDLRSQL